MTPTSLPPDIVAAVDAIMTASTADAATTATRKVLEMSGIVIADTASARTGSRARMYVTTLQLQAMAMEAQERSGISRVSFQQFASTLAGVATLPVDKRLAASTYADVVSTKVVDQPARLAALVTSWVKLAVEYHGSADPDEAVLTNPPLLLAALARRQDEPVDLGQSFAGSDLELGSLDIAVLVSGLRETMLAAEREVPASPRPSPSVSSRPSASPSTSPSATATPRPSPTATPTRTATPSTSPHAQAGTGPRLAAVSRSENLVVAGDVPVSCAGVTEFLTETAPGVADGTSWAVGTAIKAFVARFVKLALDATAEAEERLATVFEVIGILFRLQSLALFYQSVESKTEIKPDTQHKEIDTKASVKAKIKAGVPDDKWNAFRAEREASPIAAQFRDCFKAYGLPSPGSLADIPDQMKNWRAAWSMKDPGSNAEFPIEQFAGGGQSVLGRFERPLHPVSDHSAEDEVEVLVRPEKTSDHPGLAKTAHVRICNELRSNEPPNVGLVLNPSLSGSGAVGVITREAETAAKHASEVFGPSAVASLVATMVDLMASWVQFSHTIKSCGTLNVGFHEPQPGQWHGTIVVKSEYESELNSTSSVKNQCYGKGICGPEVNVMRTAERTTIRSGVEYTVSGTEPARAAGSGGPSSVSLSGTELIYGFNEFITVSYFFGYTASGCLHTTATSRDYSGTYSVESKSASVGIALDPSGKYKVSFGGSYLDALPMIPGRAAEVTQTSTRGCIGRSVSSSDSVPARAVGPAPAPLEGRLDPKSPGNRIAGSVTVVNVDGSTSTITWNLTRVGNIVLPPP